MPTQPAQPVNPRGPLSSWVLADRQPLHMPAVVGANGMSDDLQLALYLCYELHFGEVPGTWARTEWEPEMVRFRTQLEQAFLRSLYEMIIPVASSAPVRSLIPQLIEADDGPSVSKHMETVGTLEQMAEFLKHRSPYQLKEADPNTMGIPHLRGRAKQILAGIQAGEYGADDSDRMMHSELFAQTMRSFGLDDQPNAYLAELPATSLMISNLISMFGMNRAMRGCLVGHLTVFEMTSVVPMGRYARGLDRVRAPAAARRFYDVHVLADAEHERMAIEMAAALEEDEPQLRDDIIFGAQCVFVTERLFAERLFANWKRTGRTAARTAA